MTIRGHMYMVVAMPSKTKADEKPAAQSPILEILSELKHLESIGPLSDVDRALVLEIRRYTLAFRLGVLLGVVGPGRT